jgi:hypothetical protein
VVSCIGAMFNLIRRSVKDEEGRPPRRLPRLVSNERLLDGQGFYPPSETMANIQWLGEVGDADALYEQYWTELTGQK